MVNWKFFIGGCILSCGLLFKMGAPLPAVASASARSRFSTGEATQQPMTGEGK